MSRFQWITPIGAQGIMQEYKYITLITQMKRTSLVPAVMVAIVLPALVGGLVLVSKALAVDDLSLHLADTTFPDEISNDGESLFSLPEGDVFTAYLTGGTGTRHVYVYKEGDSLPFCEFDATTTSQPIASAGNCTALLSADPNSQTYNFYYDPLGGDLACGALDDGNCRVIAPHMLSLQVDPPLPVVNVTESGQNIVLASDQTPFIVNVPAGISGVTLDGTGIVTTNEQNMHQVNLPYIRIVTGDASVALYDGTKIIGPLDWPGIIHAPTASNETVTIPGGEVISAVEIGFDATPLTFDQQASRILLPGKAGQRVGYVHGTGPFTEITQVCSADTMTAAWDEVLQGEDCKVDVGSDMVVWVKHFSSFVTFKLTCSGIALEALYKKSTDFEGTDAVVTIKTACDADKEMTVPAGGTNSGSFKLGSGDVLVLGTNATQNGTTMTTVEGAASSVLFMGAGAHINGSVKNVGTIYVTGPGASISGSLSGAAVHYLVPEYPLTSSGTK